MVVGQIAPCEDRVDEGEALQRPVSHGDRNGVVLQEGNAYDPSGNRTRLDTWWGALRYTYDNNDQVTGLADPGYTGATVPAGNASYTYDTRDNMTRQDNGNGTISTFVFDENSRQIQEIL